MTSTARALVLEELGSPPDIALLDVDDPGPREVQVRMIAAGVCHTDLAAMRDAYITPIVLGHEGCGEVVAHGPGVEEPAIGTRVILCWKLPCMECRRCTAGRPDLCERSQQLREPRVSLAGRRLPGLLSTGCFSELVVVPAAAAVPVPQDLPAEQAALIGCAVATGVGAALRTARVEAGAAVAVWGLGGVGLNVVAGARLAGARPIIGIDPDEGRCELARRRGAHVTAAPGAALEQVAEHTGSRGVDHCFDAVGSIATLADGIEALATGGELIVVGGPGHDERLPILPRRLLVRQQRLVGCLYGSLRPHTDLPLLVDLCADGSVPLGDLVARTVTLDELPELFRSGPGDGVRVVVRF